MTVQEASVEQIPPDSIDRNPDNPRIIFRQDELDKLLNSISLVGIQVPLTVFLDNKRKKYILLDGERRWLCSTKLNLETVPVIVYPKPSRLENILRMFNIHNVREQWDLLPTAYKLQEVRKLMEADQKSEPSLTDLATATGVHIATVRRAFELLKLPQKYLDQLMKELQKPKSEQTLSEDFFLEMMKSIKTIEKYTPEVMEKTSQRKLIDAFVDKYQKGIITNIVKFREVSKIARSEKAGVPKSIAVPVLIRLANDRSYSLDDAFSDSVSRAYELRDITTKIKSLNEKLNQLEKEFSNDLELKENLSILQKTISELLKR